MPHSWGPLPDLNPTGSKVAGFQARSGPLFLFKTLGRVQFLATLVGSQVGRAFKFGCTSPVQLGRILQAGSGLCVRHLQNYS